MYLCNSALMLLVGWQEVIQPVKTEWWGVGVVICLERVAHLHMAQLMPLPLTVSCFCEIQIGFTFLVPAHPGSPRQRVVKRVCVCVCCVISMTLCNSDALPVLWSDVFRTSYSWHFLNKIRKNFDWKILVESSQTCVSKSLLVDSHSKLQYSNFSRKVGPFLKF